MVSLVHPLSDGTRIDVGVIGREGFVGIAVLLGANSSPIEAMVQIPGSALRMRATAFREQVARIKPFSDAAHRYAQALRVQVSQTAACNGRYVLQERLARWLLTAADPNGIIDPNTLLVTGTGIIVNQPDGSLTPVRLESTTSYYGVY